MIGLYVDDAKRDPITQPTTQLPTMRTTTILATLSLAALGTAIPSPDLLPPDNAPYIQSSFSWAAWVDSVIADPSTALSPEEALAAFNAGASNPEDLTKR
ncbi:hypothetical protein G6011_05325 [Alternaria panax]|uniref:Uncharacterized protein n=1 Tax=Alternaria panax TaxID=48097 RepID=A0AAD4I8Z5_9PLEO|nr:hypothetical protein G6011_05325 [Alternaria panax]